MKNEQTTFAPEMEGTRAIKREQKNFSGAESGPEKIDLKKMIIYSELLKPKFD
ncbi:MAG: hypothetical protein MJY48_00050 [Bacteroidales bacterium]|nr:hypothetical protein [Bacteroidales bacterium]